MGFANIEFLGLLIFLLLSTLPRESTSQYEWTCSAYDTASNRYYLPDFGGEASVLRYTWEASLPGMSYVYPIDEINCTGIVTDVEFCYNARVNLVNNPMSTLIFTLLSLNQNSHIFTVTRLIEICSTPNRDKCSGTGNTHQCCDIATLTSGDQFHLPAQNFYFGVSIPTNDDVLLLGLSDMMYRVPSYTTHDPLTLGSMTNLDVITHQTLRIMWFHITPPTTSSPTSLPISTNLPTTPTDDVSSITPGQPTTDMPTMSSDIGNMSTTPTSRTTPGQPTTDMPTMSSDIGNMSTTPTSRTTPVMQPTTDTPTLSSMGMTSSPVTSSMDTTEISSTKTSNGVLNDGASQVSPAVGGAMTSSPVTSSMDTTETSPTKTSNGVLNDGASQVGPAVGGAIGGVIAIILVVIVLVLLLMIFVFRRGRRSFKGTGAINNVMYDNRGTESMKSSLQNPGYDYAEVGPSANGSSSTKRRQVGPEGEEAYYSAVANEKLDLIPQEYEDIESNKGTLPTPLQYEAAVQLKGKTMTSGRPAQAPAEYDDIYVVPASDVDGLYTQLEEILTDSVCRDNISLGDMLGSGQFGEVFKGVWERSHDNMEVAIKTLKEGSSDDDKVKFLQEAAIMGQFKHPNVVTMYGVVTDGEPILLVLEMLKKGDLRNYLLSMRTDNEGISDEIDDHELLSYCRQVASGMAYLSNKAFVHRDLAARNILVSDDRICKIADFGMSRDLADENYYVSHGGKIPVKWTAPEALYYKKYSTASDVWSFGVVMYEIWSVGHKPFERVDNSKVIKLVNAGYRMPPPPGCPRAIYSIMTSCWHPKADGRPDFSEVSTQLSVSNSKLLQWSQEDKLEFPEASKLGPSLSCAENLYEDMQLKYKTTSDKLHLSSM